MKTANDNAISTVRHCINSLLNEAVNKRGYSLAQESYSKWAARELLIRLEKNKGRPPLMIIEEFRDQMDRYSTMNVLTSDPFSVAKDMTEWIIDLLIT